MKRGELWWAGLGQPSGSEAGHRRPLLIVSSNRLNDSVLKTVLTVPLTSTLSREHFQFNVRLSARATGLTKPSVALVNLVTATNRSILETYIGRLPDELMAKIDAAMRLVLEL